MIPNECKNNEYVPLLNNILPNIKLILINILTPNPINTKYVNVVEYPH